MYATHLNGIAHNEAGEAIILSGFQPRNLMGFET